MSIASDYVRYLEFTNFSSSFFLNSFLNPLSYNLESSTTYQLNTFETWGVTILSIIVKHIAEPTFPNHYAVKS